MSSQIGLEEWGIDPPNSDPSIESEIEDSNTDGQPTSQIDPPEKENNPLVEIAETFKSERLRPIPIEEDNYPTWWGRLESHGMSAKSLAEIEQVGNTDYHRDDREEPTWKEHFIEVHFHPEF